MLSMLTILNFRVDGNQLIIHLPLIISAIIGIIIVLVLIYWLLKKLHRRLKIRKYERLIRKAKARLADDYNRQLAMDQLNRAAVKLEDLLDVPSYNQVVHQAMNQTNYVHSHKDKSNAKRRLNQAELRRDKVRRKF